MLGRKPKFEQVRALYLREIIREFIFVGVVKSSTGRCQVASPPPPCTGVTTTGRAPGVGDLGHDVRLRRNRAGESHPLEFEPQRASTELLGVLVGVRIVQDRSADLNLVGERRVEGLNHVDGDGTSQVVAQGQPRVRYV